MITQLDILCYQIKPAVPGISCILMIHCPMETSIHKRLSAKQLVTLHNLIVRLFCYQQLHMLLIMEKSSWCPEASLLLTNVHGAIRFYILPEKKTNHQYRPDTNSDTHNSNLLSRYIVALMAQML